MRICCFYIFLILVIWGCQNKNEGRILLTKNDLAAGTYHTQHAKIFGKYSTGYNLAILQGIDSVQAHADSGGGYFIGIHAQPTESPIGYPLSLMGQKLLDPPRSTSYCSGSSYAAFIEGLDIIYKTSKRKPDAAHYEALRMQEPDGSRREDHSKFWGKWNADGYGNHFALIQYAGLGERIPPSQARPGDFMNISWKKGGGHSVVFLGWYLDKTGEKKLLYWSSQQRTNGFGDDLVPIGRIAEVLVVRLTQPDHIFDFDLREQKDQSIPGDLINW